MLVVLRLRWKPVGPTRSRQELRVRTVGGLPATVEESARSLPSLGSLPVRDRTFLVAWSLSSSSPIALVMPFVPVPLLCHMWHTWAGAAMDLREMGWKCGG